jgi:adenylate cyclase
MAYPIPENEAGRLEALHTYGILDSAPEIAYDDLTELAAQICGCPVAYITFIDEERGWLKSKYGLPADLSQVPREIGFCSVTICGQEMIMSPDLTADERFNKNPMVSGDPGFRFYCAAPLITPDGYALGTICTMDFEPKTLEPRQQESLRRLRGQVMAQLELRRRLVESDNIMRELDVSRAAAAAAHRKTEELLANILPQSIAVELRDNGKVAPRYFPSATILFADFKGFTQLTERLEPAALIGLLDQYFSMFDEIMARHDLEKLKTIGDSYMAVAGVPYENRSHPAQAALAALEMQATVQKMKVQREKIRLPALDLRIGLHTGPVIAGVVGKRKFTYDIWGDAVNVAARLEAAGEPGRINVSSAVKDRLAAYFDLTPRGSIEAKNKGQIEMFFLDRVKAEFAKDADGRTANDKLRSEMGRATK